MKVRVFEFKENLNYREISSLPADNSGLLYGQNPFTSLRLYQGKVIFFEDHKRRLRLSGDYIFGPSFPWEKMNQCIDELKREWEASKAHRYLRLTMTKSKSDSVFYLSLLQEDLSEVWQMPPALSLTSSYALRNSYAWPDFIKLGQYSAAFFERSKAQARGFDELIYFDKQEKDETCLESSTSNIFIRDSKGQILTPPSSSKVLAGIARKRLILCLKAKGFNVEEAIFSQKQVLLAQDIWLTNAVKGIIPVRQFEDKAIHDTGFVSQIWGWFKEYSIHE